MPGVGRSKARTQKHRFNAHGRMKVYRWERHSMPTTNLDAQDRVILFCVAIGIDHSAVGIPAKAMQSMAIRGFIEHDRTTGAYRLDDSGRATLGMILDHAGIKVPP
jgi:hypothetical protein